MKTEPVHPWNMTHGLKQGNNEEPPFSMESDVSFSVSEGRLAQVQVQVQVCVGTCAECGNDATDVAAEMNNKSFTSGIWS